VKICIYSSHHGTKSGGENHSLSLIDSLKDNYDVTVMIDHYKQDRNEEIYEFMGDEFRDKVTFVPLDIPSIKFYDVFININHGFMLPPLARRNIILCFYPQFVWDTNGYDTIITNSSFTKQQIVERWKRKEDDIHVVYPVLNLEQFFSVEKKRQILTIGRFFQVPDGNNKNHKVMIEAFKRLDDPEAKLIIVGSIQDRQYYDECVELARNHNISFMHDVSQGMLIKLYAESKVYWHAAGYEAKYPSSMEHFGMVALEAMASKCLPIVHNSGGMPESGAATWSDISILIEKTKVALDNQADSFAWPDLSKYSVENIKEQYIEIIEKPIAVYRPSEADTFDRPTVRVSIDPKEITVGIIGDAPNLTTGFGLVEKMFGQGFKQAGFNVTQIGVQDENTEPKQDDPWRVWRPGHSPITAEILHRWITKDKPNILWLNYDAGNIASWLNMLASIKCQIPVIAYFPVEGFPIPRGFGEMARMIAKPITYLKWGSDLFRDQENVDVDWVPHGVNHAPFRRFSEEERRNLKEGVGWQDKFVIGFFGRNKRTKQHPRVIETVRMLKEEGITDLVLYMHTQNFEHNMMNGWALDQIIEYNGVSEMVCIPPNFNQTHGVSYSDPTPIDDIAVSAIDWDNDPKAAQKAHNLVLNSYSLVERYNLCDLFISVSQAEGFNLPLGEAMACGVPIICVNDSGSQSEVVGEAGILIDPIEWDTWHVGTLLPIVSKKKLMFEIMKVMADPQLRATMSDASLERAKNYLWEYSTSKMNKIVIETYNKVLS